MNDAPERLPVRPDPRDLPGPFGHRVAVEVRFADTDAMGHVNNATYLTYCEIARAGYYRDVTGVPFPGRAGATEPSLILADAQLTFRSPAFFGETLTIETRVGRIGRSSFDMEHRISAPEGGSGPARLVAVARTVLVSYDYDRAAVTPLPDELVRLAEAFEGRRLRELASG